MAQWLIHWTVNQGKATSCGSAIVKAESKGGAWFKFLQSEHEKLELMHRPGAVQVQEYHE